MSRIESVEFINVCFGYGDRAEYLLDNISFQFERGDCIKVIAPNGAGKSTMFKLLQGVYKPLGGDVRLNDQSLEVYDPTAVNQEIVYIGQRDKIIFFVQHGLHTNINYNKNSSNRQSVMN
ncbi:MAG: ATP-binding cassette domain-containing protein [Eubacteriales bacterium]|nr:ATP-binding cassette domain-containing protein [Clostridiales bacterium]MDY5835903.1 ATP-binding cassette domain-containing protein [Eubacteriales bacterium]